MTTSHFQTLFHSQNVSRDAFLSRLLGIFSEETVRLWCNDSRAPYKDLGRPTIKDSTPSRRTTLDFTFQSRSTQRVYVVEMKCWTSYEKNRYLTLRDASQLEPLRKQKSFDRFLEFTHSPDKYVVTVSNKGQPAKRQPANGSILIWATCDNNGRKSSIAKYGMYDVLSLEDIIDNLLHWGSLPYIEFLDQREKWCYELFNGLRSKYTNNS